MSTRQTNGQTHPIVVETRHTTRPGPYYSYVCLLTRDTSVVAVRTPPTAAYVAVLHLPLRTTMRRHNIRPGTTRGQQEKEGFRGTLCVSLLLASTALCNRLTNSKTSVMRVCVCFVCESLRCRDHIPSTQRGGARSTAPKPTEEPMLSLKHDVTPGNSSEAIATCFPMGSSSRRLSIAPWSNSRWRTREYLGPTPP